MPSFELILGFAVCLSTVISLVLIFSPTTYKGASSETAPSDASEPRYQILVLGDIGRSPRMQYHAISISKHGGLVDLIGYRDSELHPLITSQPSITVHNLPRTPDILRNGSHGLFLFWAPLKILSQIGSLWTVLGYRTKPAKWLIVQNPPSIPTLLVAQVICFFRNTRLIIDWHNFGYSILALKLGRDHPFVLISRWYEQLLSHFATAHFAVTEAMARTLKRDHQISAPIFALHDRPAPTFRPLEPSQRLSFLGRFPETAPLIDDIATGKMKVLVSSTSWTPDEDFSVLLEALVTYSDLAISTHPHLPELLVMITGKGPGKEQYLSDISALIKQDKLEMVSIKTAWLSTEDYANLLGSADLGISLHQSSSGVDLPMKVVDMFGAGLPVIGWSKFEAWPELVKEGVNGKGFGTASELQEVLIDLLGGDGSELQNLRLGAVEESKRGWDNEWDGIAGKLLGFC